MGRAFRAALWVLVLAAVVPGPSRAVESVTIESENALPGIWRFPPHERRSDWSQHGSDVVASFAAIGPEKYCRIGRTSWLGYTFNCLEVAERSPRARLSDGGSVRLSWEVLFGVPGCRWTYNGRLRSGTEMSGHLGMACGMVLREKPEPMTVTKLVLSEKTPDAGAQAAYLRRLLQEMASGTVTEPYADLRFVSSNPEVVPLPDHAQRKLMEFLTPYSLRVLGDVTAVVYVSEYTPIAGWWYAKAGPVYSDKRSSIYAVEFENGERLCALHRRPDGVLDLFQCI